MFAGRTASCGTRPSSVRPPQQAPMTDPVPSHRSPPAPAAAAGPLPGLDASSVRSVLALLQTDHALTGKEIRTRSGLPRRTVYSALRVVSGGGVVVPGPGLRDTGQPLFWVAWTVDADSAASVRDQGLGAPGMSAA